MLAVAEIAVGALFAVGAAFNVVYTLRNSEEFYGEFADRAWLAPAGRMINRLVIPNGVAFTVLLIVFQMAVAAAVLSRGALVGPALVVGGCFAAVVALFSSPGGAVGNVALATLQFALAWTR